MSTISQKEQNTEEAIKGKGERLQELSGSGLVFLQEAKTLLVQLKRGGVILYPVIENEIRGLSNGQITNIYMLLNRVYDKFIFDYEDERYIEKELVRNTDGKHIKTINHLKFSGDVLENFVFSLAEVKDAGRGSYERCYVEGQLLGLALEEIEEVLSNETKYLILKGDVFIYNGDKMKFGSNTHTYRCLRTIYECSGGKSCQLSYKALCDSLRNWDRYKLLSDDQLKETLTKYVSSEKSELGMKLKPVENNGQKLIDTDRNIGITFNNG